MNIFLRELKANLKSLLIWSVIIALLIMMADRQIFRLCRQPRDAEDAGFHAHGDAGCLEHARLQPDHPERFLRHHVHLLWIDGRHRGRHVGQRHHLQGRARQDGRVFAGAAGLPQPGHHRQGAGCPGQLHRLRADHLGGVAGGGAAVSTPTRPSTTSWRSEMQAMFVIELIFLAIGLLLGCAMKQYKRSGSTAVAIILVTYFMSVVTVMQEKLDFLKYFTPFKYFDADALFRSGRMDSTYLLLSVAIIVVCVAVAYLVYNRRDLYI